MIFALTSLPIHGAALEGNPLGDPVDRALPVLAPERIDGPLPTVLLLAGYAGRGAEMLVDEPWAEGLARRLDRLAAEGRIGPMIVALPDCFTRLGGSQYLSSSATGRYEEHLWSDILPSLRAHFPVGRVGLAGKSSGGYAALVQAMRHPEIVSAVASHSGDLYFEYCLARDFPSVARTLRRRGGVAGFLAHFAAAAKKYDEIDVMNILCMAACYSPDPGSPHGFQLPFDVETGERDEAVWARWLALDPVRMVEQPGAADALRSLRLLHVECGMRDEHFLDLGARIFCRRLSALGVPHHHEEFDDNHRSLSYRFDVSLPALYQALR